MTLRQIGIGRLRFENLVEMSGIFMESYVRMLCKIEKGMCQNIRQEKRLKHGSGELSYIFPVYPAMIWRIFFAEVKLTLFTT